MRQVLLVGASLAGKTSLCTSLKLVDEMTSAPNAPLEFGFASTGVCVFALNALSTVPLLQIFIRDGQPMDCVVLVLDATRPWLIDSELDAWTQALGDIAFDKKNLIVVLNKVDLIRSEAGNVELDNRLDFVQFHLRKRCMALNASLVYTSALTGVNLQELKHLVLRASSALALTSARLSCFIPRGSDTAAAAFVLLRGSSLFTSDTPLHAVVPSPTKPSTQAEGLAALDGRAFIQHLADLKPAAAATTTTSTTTTTAAAAGAISSPEKTTRTPPRADASSSSEPADDVLGYFEGLLKT